MTEQEFHAIRILYMEDDPGLSRLLQKSLQRRGYVVDLASNGEEGLSMIHGSPYDLLLVDYNMPFCGGMEVIKALTDKGSLIPTIMVTGDGNEEVAVEALKLGAADYVVKDAEMKYLELLPVIIEQVLYKQQLLRERQQMLEDLRQSEERYRRLVELSPDGIAVHVDDAFTFVNPAGARLLGLARPGDLVGRPLLEIVHPEFRDLVRERLETLRSGADHVPWIEEKLLCADGREIEVEASSIAFPLKGKQAVLKIFRDIRERKLAQERLQQMALYDGLTGLPNRTLFFDRMGQLLELAKRNEYVIAVLYMDLDRFKDVNDTLGHDAGDALLRETARRMKASIRKSDTVARMGGDEFIGICAKITAAKDAGVVAQKIIDVLSAPFPLKGQECRIGVSIGISVFPQDGSDVDTLLKNADAAMYRVKESGRNGYQFSSPC